MYKSFEEMMQKAILGDVEALNKLLYIYEPLINYRSKIDGEFDEDCRQYIMMRIMKNIPKFKL